MNSHRRAFITAAVLVAASGVVAGTTASYNALTQNSAGTFTIDAVTAPVGGTLTGITASGDSVAFGTAYNPTTAAKYTSAGTPNAPYTVLASAGATTATACPAANTTSTKNYTTIVGTGPAGDPTTLTPVGTPFAIGGNATAGPGSFVCFMVTGSSGTANSVYSLSGGIVSARVRVGHVVSTVTWTNGAANNTIAAGDQIVITFNQAVNTGTGPVNTAGTPPTSGDAVCVYGDGDLVVIGSANYTTTPCTAADATNATVGVLRGMNVTAGVSRTFAATYAWTSGNTVLTVTLGTMSTNGSGTLGATRVANVFEPTTNTAKLVSASGAVPLCSATNSSSGQVTVCQPTWTFTSGTRV